MIKEAIEKIQALTRKADGPFTGKDGKEYISAQYERLYDDPRPDPLKIYSLDGLKDYLSENVDKLEMDKLIIHVVDHETVFLLTDVHGEKNERHKIMEVRLDGNEFAFDRFVPQEKFIISVKSLFQHTEDMDLILHHTAKVSTESAVLTHDDGVTQQVQVKQGIKGALVEANDLKSIVTLKPYRTFREVEQVESEFLFRMRTGDGVECALFEADGGTWKNKARQKTAEYLKDTGVSIIA